MLPTSAVWPIDVRSTFDLPGGRVVAGRLHGAPEDPDERGGWPDGLVWLRLGLSEALRATCVAHLGSRRTGDAYILHQQLVRGVLADAAATQLEVRAVLEGISDGTPDPAGLGLLNVQITTADREQVRLLGASGYLASGPGTVAYASELLAEVHTTAGASA
ncbi:hypothetical protein [Pseudonocardia alni]|uniref:hypothetical protein n=1 Tax=Pseudonocardia alni TaxID=33907 RepID=UPI0033F5D597